MRKILLIVASGLSSRFGGYPKALCDIGGIRNADNTALKAAPYYEKVYIGVNKEIYKQYKGVLNYCEMFPIETGHGDAHSLYRCMNVLQDKEYDLDFIDVCWGDAVFLDNLPFEIASSVDKRGEYNCPVTVVCALDKQPYAWFDLDLKYIQKVHFSSEEGLVEKGMHDQSLFLFEYTNGVEYLRDYRDYLHIPENSDEWGMIKEMKLLYSFEFLYQSRKYSAATVLEIEAGHVLSFNTQEELVAIKSKAIIHST